MKKAQNQYALDGMIANSKGILNELIENIDPN
jgi:hypothetical protein